ncbi:MAG: hemolysin family protein [Erysipelotrichaceae bacterium]|jgi:CBS domain containing-hemolysin-like protein|nr:hemolysin family protein [Erysipelotrichaceae bacterium]
MNKFLGPISAIVFLIFCSAFFSACEIAYASANKLRLRKNANTGRLSAKLALFISEHYDQALCTILMGNNLVNIAAASLATAIALALVGEVGVAAADIIMTALILIFGEIMPKQIANTIADRFVSFVALPLRLLMLLTKPLVIIIMAFVKLVSKLWGGKGKISGMSEEELVTIIETVEEEGIIDAQRSDLLQSAIDFANTQAQEVLTHRVDVDAIDIDDPLNEILKQIEDTNHSRFPVYQNNIDNILGVLHVNHLLKALIDKEDIDLKTLITPVAYIHQSTLLPVVLRELQAQKIPMAVIVDDFGGTLGILTVEDLLEEIVGEIWDETDEVYEEFKQVSPHIYDVDGDMNIDDFFEALDKDLPQEEDEEYTTVGGWCLENLGNFPKENDQFEYEDLKVTITEMEDLRIVKVRVEVLDEYEE